MKRIPFLAALAVVSFLSLTALPTAQDRDHDRDRDRDHDRDHDRRVVIVPREPVMRDFGGGNGGRPSPDAICAPGFVGVGLHVQIGEYFNTAWLDCARLRPDGDVGDEHGMTERTGSRGGREVRDAYCVGNRVLRGIAGRTGASIDEVSGECTPVRDIVERDPRPATEMTQAIARPRPEGRPAEVACPIGFVVTGLRSTSGEYMDHLWLLCSELQRNY